MKVPRILQLLLLFALLLAACAPAAQATPPELPSVDQPAPTSEEIALPTEAAAVTDPAALPTLTLPPSATLPAPSATAVAVAEECPFTPDLHATDPATVALASGKVQLVEFFAFW